MKFSLPATTIGLIAFAIGTHAAVSRTCPDPSNGICYSLNIPDETTSSGNGDIFFQLSAPTSFQWVALGQGSQMAGSNIFVMYTSTNGQNVTVSPRVGVGHVEPEHDGDTAQITVLEGSGVNNGVMTANVRCSNCNTWNGGSMNFQASNGNWIYAARSGAPLNSDDIDEGLSIHDVYSPFTWDFTSAKGGNDVNPFLAASTNSNTTTTSPAGGEFTPPKNIRQIMIAHGVLACLAWVIFFPLGGIIIRVASFPSMIKVHVGIQMLAYVLFIAAFGMGVWMSSTFHATDNRHPIIGIVVFAIIIFQPIFGVLHHHVFKKTFARNVWSFIHLTIGRIAILLGIVNGGLGLAMAGNAPRGAIIAYGVISGVIGVVYIGAIVYGESKKLRQKRTGALQNNGERRQMADTEK